MGQITVIRGGGTFTELSDAPDSYSGQSGKLIGVKVAEDGLEFTAAGGVGDMLQSVYDTGSLGLDVYDWKVGMICMTIDNVNPNTLLGYGTWELMDSGNTYIKIS